MNVAQHGSTPLEQHVGRSDRKRMDEYHAITISPLVSNELCIGSL